MFSYFLTQKCIWPDSTTENLNWYSVDPRNTNCVSSRMYCHWWCLLKPLSRNLNYLGTVWWFNYLVYYFFISCPEIGFAYRHTASRLNVFASCYASTHNSIPVQSKNGALGHSIIGPIIGEKLSSNILLVTFCITIHRLENLPFQNKIHMWKLSLLLQGLGTLMPWTPS